MPPTATEKRRRWPIFAEIQEATKSTQIDADLKPLTYAECEILVRRLADTTDRLGEIRAAAESCILNSAYSPTDSSATETTWTDICDRQADKSRLM